jgi:hypothetical protein
MTSARIARVALRASLLAALVAPGLASPAHASLPDRIVHAARVELARGVHETPNGSNESKGIARYRKAVRWSTPRTPWCGYFVSYVAQQAGVPLGESGQGIGAVDEIRRWAKRTKRWRATPHRGNIAVFRGHVGIVERVVGTRYVVTIEGNHSNRVARVWRSRSEVRGYVRLHSVPRSSAPEQSVPVSDDQDVTSPDDPSSSEDDPGYVGDDPGDTGDDFDPGDELPDDLP